MLIRCFRFKEDIEAVKMANDTEYGLAAYFYTKVATTSSEPATDADLLDCNDSPFAAGSGHVIQEEHWHGLYSCC
jgi:acyl-CoA reductase-like NAD-dependent aldehyde dehydrogenase